MDRRKQRRPNLSEDEKQSIRDYRAAHPKLFYREIAAALKYGTNTVFLAINGAHKKPPANPVPERMALPPRCTIKQPDSIISPIPLSLLMAGRAPRAKSFAA